MQKKKIAFIVAVPGSAQAFLKDHFCLLVKDYEVHLAANFPNKESEQEFTNMGIVCQCIPIERKINLAKDIQALFALQKLFKDQQFESIHSVTPKAGLLASIAGRIAKIPHRIHIYTGQVWATKKGLMRCLLKFMDKVIALLDTDLLVDGESQRQYLITEGILKEKNSSVLANGSICGVKVERFIISDEIRKSERTRFGFSDTDVIYIFLGRLNHDKGIGELYQAFNMLVAECPNAKLVLYGNDEEEYDEKTSKYKNIIRNVNYFYPGRTSKPYDALQGGDVFVLPTWREGFGSSVIEAQALALPVITSDAYGVMDASVPNVTGLRCKVNDVIGLYNCMKEYYYRPEMRKEHGMNGRQRVIEKFDNKIVSAAWVAFYHRIVIP